MFGFDFLSSVLGMTFTLVFILVVVAVLSAIQMKVGDKRD